VAVALFHAMFSNLAGIAITPAGRSRGNRGVECTGWAIGFDIQARG